MRDVIDSMEITRIAISLVCGKKGMKSGISGQGR
jgi:hypothetical protein